MVLSTALKKMNFSSASLLWFISPSISSECSFCSFVISMESKPESSRVTARESEHLPYEVCIHLVLNRLLILVQLVKISLYVVLTFTILEFIHVIYESGQLFEDIKKIKEYISVELFFEILELEPDKLEILKVENMIIKEKRVTDATIEIIYVRLIKHRVSSHLIIYE